MLFLKAFINLDLLLNILLFMFNLYNLKLLNMY